MWRLHLGQIDALDEAIAQVDARVGKLLEPLRAQADLLTTVAKTSSTPGAHHFTSDHELAWELLRYVDAASAKRYAEEASQKSP